MSGAGLAPNLTTGGALENWMQQLRPATIPAAGPNLAVPSPAVAQTPTAPPPDPLAPVMAKIAGGESGGHANPYGARYGFPDLPGAPGPQGESHALGKYQFEPDTWRQASKEIVAQGGPPPDFNNPADQERVARYWASKTYHEKTGRDLAADARANKVDYSALAGQWPSLMPRSAAGGTPAFQEFQRQSQDLYRQRSADARRFLQEAEREPPGSQSRQQRIQQVIDNSEAMQREFMDLMRHPPTEKPADILSNFGSAATIIAMLGGFLSKRPLTASLGAAASAMEAMNTNNHEQFKRSFETWQQQAEMTSKIIGMQTQEIRDVLDDERLSETERMARLHEIYSAYGMQSQADAARMGDWATVYKMQESMDRAADQHNLAVAQIGELAARASAQQQGKWQVMIDPSRNDEKGNPIAYRYNPSTGQATTIDGSAPYSPGGAAKVGTTAGGQQFTDRDVDFWAGVLKQGGHFPPGLARTSAGSAFVQKVMSKMGHGGDPGQFIAGQATVKADESSLRNMTRMADAATSFERTAKENFDYALTLAPEGIPTDWGPWLNSWVENGEKALGDPNIPAYATALLTAANEYAKIMSGSTGAQGSTVDSRREAADTFSPFLNSGQIRRVVEVAERDMSNREQSLYGQVSDIRSRLRNPGPTSAPVGGKAKYTIGQTITAPDGRKYRVTGGDLSSDPDVEPIQ